MDLGINDKILDLFIAHIWKYLKVCLISGNFTKKKLKSMLACGWKVVIQENIVKSYACEVFFYTS